MPLTLRATLVILLAIAGATLPALSADPGTRRGPRGEVIYSDDNRLDLYQVTHSGYLRLADSTVALFRSRNVTVNGKAAHLKLSRYSRELRLCEGEPFFEQPTGAFCSGSLVAPDLVLTAGHCLRLDPTPELPEPTEADACRATRFVFGFAAKIPGRIPSAVPTSEVYSCAEVVASELDTQGPDYALVRLDRPVPNHAPLAVNRQGPPVPGTKLVVIGHPSGLPTKVTDGAKVREAARNGYFRTNLDTYGGNSGSPVFNTQTGRIEGVLVRGEQDFVFRDGCMVSKRCTADSCRGEDVTQISLVADRIPEVVASSAGRGRPGLSR